MKNEKRTGSIGAAVRRRGFSLLEMIGVLAVLSVLALGLAVALVRHLDIAAVNSETATLNSLNNALTAHVLHSSCIPSEGQWAAALGNWLGLPQACITTNGRRYARAYLVDSGGWPGANLPTTGYFSQSAAGTLITNSARLMIVSSLSADLPVATGRPSAAAFNELWTNPPTAIPSSWSGWKGRADDLLIQRIDLRPFFSQVVLVNRDNANAATFGVAGQTTSLPGHSLLNTYFINGSVLSLGSTSAGTTVWQTSQVLNGSISFVYENGQWSARIGKGLGLGPTRSMSAIAAAFNVAVQRFLAAPDSPNNANPGGAAGDQQQVLAAMSDFMVLYLLWAGEHFAQHGMSDGQAKNHLSAYSYLVNSRTWLSRTAGTTRNINTNTPPCYSGLLY
jgi:prepilin-type N-terminal cleavage/methylation domain-containing protein